MTFDWAAGLFDGEGSMGLYKKGPVMLVEMTSKEAVETFWELVGVGTVTELAPRGQYQKVWRWRTTSVGGIARVLEVIGGKLIAKREQAQLMGELVGWYRQRTRGKVYSEQDLCHLRSIGDRLKALKRQVESNDVEMG